MSDETTAISPPTGAWLLASIELSKLVPTTGAYPHVCRMGGGTRWSKTCAACVAAGLAPAGDEIEALRHGIDGHACGPAGRGNATLERWECPDCGAAWRPVTSERTERTPIVTITWERVAG